LEKLIKPFKGKGYHTFSHNEGVLDPSEAKTNSIMIFDDVACEKQDNIRSYFCMGRHILGHIYRDHINTDVNYETFVKICQKCWEDKHGSLIINKDNEMDNGRYRKGFDQFIMILGVISI